MKVLHFYKILSDPRAILNYAQYAHLAHSNNEIPIFFGQLNGFDKKQTQQK